MAIIQKIRSKLRRTAIHLYRDMKHSLHLDTGLYAHARGSRILIYHGICLKDNTRFNPIFLKLKTFEQQLIYYKKHFNVVSLDDHYAGKFSKDKFNICLTFDDGFANNHKYVLPLLQKYQLPATFFITGIRQAGYDILWNDFLGLISKLGPKEIFYKNEHYILGDYHKYFSQTTGVRLVDNLRAGSFAEKAEVMKLLYPLAPFKNDEDNIDYWLQMTEAQIKEVAASPYVTVGAHGYYHNDLAKIPLADSIWEMQQTKNYLENLTQKQVTSLAFPYGSYTPDVIYEAQKIGYTQLLAMDLLFDDDAQNSTLRDRLTINPLISPNNQMYATIKRQYVD